MSYVPAMWVVWAALVLITLILNVFKGRLESNDEEMLFLDDSLQQEKAHHSATVARVNKMQPILRASMIITTSATLFVVVYYLRDIYVQLFGK